MKTTPDPKFPRSEITSPPANDPEWGATATEYAILVGLLALVMVFGLAVFGRSVENYYTSLAQQLADLLN